jgi:hypothetical protein
MNAHVSGRIILRARRPAQRAAKKAGSRPWSRTRAHDSPPGARRATNSALERHTRALLWRLERGRAKGTSTARTNGRRSRRCRVAATGCTPPDLQGCRGRSTACRPAGSALDSVEAAAHLLMHLVDDVWPSPVRRRSPSRAGAAKDKKNGRTRHGRPPVNQGRRRLVPAPSAVVPRRGRLDNPACPGGFVPTCHEAFSCRARWRITGRADTVPARTRGPGGAAR